LFFGSSKVGKFNGRKLIIVLFFSTGNTVKNYYKEIKKNHIPDHLTTNQPGILRKKTLY